MGVDVSKAAVDARIAKRDARLNAARAQTAIKREVVIGLLTAAATLVGLWVWSGQWMGALLAIIVFGLAFAIGQAVAKAFATPPAA
jgi:hypothetical protein